MSGLTRGMLIVLVAWVAACGGQSGTKPRSRGEVLFTLHCSSCHSITPGTVIVGPTLAGVGARAGAMVAGMDARTYLETSIVDPGQYLVDGYRDVMPRRFGEALPPRILGR